MQLDSFPYSHVTTYNDSSLIVVQVDPRDLKFDYCLEAVELFLQVYENDAAVKHWIGAKYLYGEPGLKLINETVLDPSQRVDKEIDMLKSYRKLLYSISQIYHFTFLNSSMRLYLTYIVKDNTVNNNISDNHSNRQLVGVAGLHFPKYMPQTPLPWSLRIYRYWLIAKWFVSDFWAFGFSERPLNNQRVQAFNKSMANTFENVDSKNIDQLATLPQQEIENCVYAPSAVPWLQPMYVHPHMQGKGIGTHMLETIFGQFRQGAKVQFISSDGKHKSEGPLKIVIDSSVEGLGLYKKFGFKPIVTFTPELDTPSDYYITRLIRVW